MVVTPQKTQRITDFPQESAILVHQQYESALTMYQVYLVSDELLSV